MAETITLSEPSSHVRTVALERPEVLNAYNEQLLEDVVAILEELAADDNVRAIVLTGAGEAFCTGVDLEDMPLTPEMDFAEYEEGLGKFQEVVRTLRTIRTPVIAAVNGYAVGAGCDTALACDFRIAGESGVLGETFIDVGFVPGDGGAYLLPRLIGEERAKELIFTGRKIRGTEIAEWDLARDVVPDEQLLDEAIAFAETLAERPPVAIAESKRLVNDSFDADLETALQDATRAQRICSETRDHQEAVEAFREDREPKFEGR
jgi:2-(1,2-epoxy-1,2-dihydrophenyl)acetyl-CoA isomerase